MKRISVGATAFAILAVPASVRAANINNFFGFTDTFTDIIGALVSVIFALAFLYFFYGVFEYVTTAGEDRKGATERIVGGLVALFVMFSVYGLINVIQGTFRTDYEQKIPTPTI